MKSVLMAIHPEWCELIANGKKTIEVRKTRPKIETPFKCLIYCTKRRRALIKNPLTQKLELGEKFPVNRYLWYNTKVIGEFICRNIDRYDYDQAFDESMGCYINKYGYDITSQELSGTCLSYEEFEKYGNTYPLYGRYISDLKIYDEPKELSEFYVECKGICVDTAKKILCLKTKTLKHFGCDRKIYIKSPPQSWCYVEVEE